MDKELYQAEIEELYKRALESEELEIRGYASTALISKYIQRQEYDKAQKLIDSFPEMTFDKKQMQANLLKAREKDEEATELLEKHLLMDITNVYSRLTSLMELSLKAKDIERAQYLAGLCQETAQRFGLSQYTALLPNFCSMQQPKIKKPVSTNWRKSSLPWKKNGTLPIRPYTLKSGQIRKAAFP